MNWVVGLSERAWGPHGRVGSAGVGAGEDALCPNSKTPARKSGKSRPAPKGTGQVSGATGPADSLIQCQEQSLLVA